MKKSFFFIVFLSVLTLSQVNAQFLNLNDDENGDWSAQYVTLYDTPEAEMMIRTGDIDNLGFGWPADFDPFSGLNTPAHTYPWDLDTTDASGTDRIMVVSSYNGSPPHGQDGYTTYTSRPDNLPRPIVLNYDLGKINVSSAAVQIFVDDFQANYWWANYFVTINGVDAPYVAEIANALSQTGPIGKIINFVIPAQHLWLLESDSLSIYFDDNTTGAGDGYAIDFVKLLINPTGYTYTAKLVGRVIDPTSQPVENAIVTASGSGQTLTDIDGNYYFADLPAGITNVTVTKFSYDTAALLIDLKVDDSVRRDFVLHEVLDAEFFADEPVASVVPHTVQFTDQSSMNPTQWLWDFGDGTTSEQQHPEHEYTSTGYYTVALTASNGLETNTETKEHYVQLSVEGIEEHLFLSKLLIVPNPVQDNASLTFSLNDASMVSADLNAINGEVVKNILHQNLQKGDYNFEFSCDDLSEGIYLISCSVANKEYVQKIIVAH